MKTAPCYDYHHILPQFVSPKSDTRRARRLSLLANIAMIPFAIFGALAVLGIALAMRFGGTEQH